MVRDSFREVTNTGWLSRVGNSFGGMAVGAAMAMVSVPLLWWNEGNAVRTSKGLAEGERAAVSAKADAVDPSLAGKLVHVTGHAAGKDVLMDESFGLALKGYLKLRRVVELYQWAEESKTTRSEKFGGGEETVTDYSYTKKWDDEIHRSENFKHRTGHENPEPLFKGKVFISRDATMGAYKLPEFLLESWSDLKPLPLPAAEVLPASIKERAKVTDEWLVISAKPDTLTVGDARVMFEGIAPGSASVLAAQVGDTLEPFYTSQGTRIARIASGVKSKEAMFAEARSEAKFFRWLLRGLGFMAMFLGIAGIMSPLKALAKVIPFLGSVVGAASGVVAFLLALCGSSIVIALAWVMYRPLIALPLLLVAIGSLVMLIRASGKINLTAVG